MNNGNKKRRIGAWLLAGLMGWMTLMAPMSVLAQIAGPDAFSQAGWEMIHEEAMQGADGVVQSVCATKDYIICIENTSDFVDTPDVISAYYKNSTDAAGNPVEQYSLAKRVNDKNWEHGNGMTYNPNTNEIYVALYSNQTDAARGCIYVMDPDTLEYVRSIKVTDDYNLLGIAYKSDSDQYVIQTNAEGGYSFKLLDANFQVVEDLGQYAGTAKGDNFQDLEVSGDYIINFPLTLQYGLPSYLNVYSMSQRSLMTDVQLSLTSDGPSQEEPEGICEINPGEYLLVDNLTYDDGRRLFRFYRTTVPYYFTVQASAENGAVQLDSTQILRGESTTLNLAPNTGYAVSQILIDGTPQSVTADMTTYTLDNVQGNHTIQVIYAPLAATEAASTLTSDPQTQEAQSVNDVRVQQSINQEVANPTPKKTTFWTKNMILLVVLLGVTVVGMISFYAYIVHIRRVRARQKALLRARRRKAMWEKEMERTSLT